MTARSFSIYAERNQSPALRDALAHVAACEARLKNTLYLLRVYVKQFRVAEPGPTRRLIKQYGIEWEKGLARVHVEQLHTAREHLCKLRLGYESGYDWR